MSKLLIEKNFSDHDKLSLIVSMSHDKYEILHEKRNLIKIYICIKKIEDAGFKHTSVLSKNPIEPNWTSRDSIALPGISTGSEGMVRCARFDFRPLFVDDVEEVGGEEGAASSIGGADLPLFFSCIWGGELQFRENICDKLRRRHEIKKMQLGSRKHS